MVLTKVDTLSNIQITNIVQKVLGKVNKTKGKGALAVAPPRWHMASISFFLSSLALLPRPALSLVLLSSPPFLSLSPLTSSRSPPLLLPLFSSSSLTGKEKLKGAFNEVVATSAKKMLNIAELKVRRRKERRGEKGEEQERKKRRDEGNES